MFYIGLAFVSILIALLLVAILQKTTNPKRLGEGPEDPNLHYAFDDFYRLACQLLEKLGLEIKEGTRVSDREVDLYTVNPTPIIGGPVIVHLVYDPKDGKVGSVDVMNFSSNLVGERKGKGLLITTGKIAEEVELLPELPPMEFIDGEKFTKLLKENEIQIEAEKKPQKES